MNRQAIPQTLVDRIKKSATFNQGFATVEYLSAALVDMKMHLAGDRKIDPTLSNERHWPQLGMPKEIVMRHRTPQFLTCLAAMATRLVTTAISGQMY
jgi:peptidyl-dipeptidase Dcp